MFNSDRFLPRGWARVFFLLRYFRAKVFRPPSPACVSPQEQHFFISLFLWLLQLTVTCTILTSGLEMSLDAMHSYEPDCSFVMAASCKCCPSVTNLCIPAREVEKVCLPARASSRRRRPGDGVEQWLLTWKTHRRAHNRISAPPAAGLLLNQHLLSSQMSPRVTTAHYTRKTKQFHHNRSTWVTPQITTDSCKVKYLLITDA